MVLTGLKAYSLSFFSTKAETLARFKPLLQKARVLDLLYFSVDAWGASADTIIDDVVAAFPGRRLAVRSSAHGEDGIVESMAGRYRTVLDVDGADRAAVRAAVETVITSYAGDPRDQVLVQVMLEDVQYSGVILSYDLHTGAPYYMLNYDDESGRTDRITGGVGVNKTVMVHRDSVRACMESPRVAEIVDMAREVEEVCGRGTPLDIEFARTADGLFVLQVRCMTVQKHWNRRTRAQALDVIDTIESFVVERSKPRPGVVGDRTILGQMSDWNPAEIIGTRPRPLAVTLYRSLITDDVWRQARASMGYRAVDGERLMVVVGGRPYIDVRNSFNSFLPAGLKTPVAHAIVNAWLDRLAENPQLHDKVEFQVAQTVHDFNFDADFQERYGGLLAPRAFRHYKARLQELTRRNVSLSTEGSLSTALEKCRELERRQQRANVGTLWEVRNLLKECRDLGTRPFAVIARHAFIAEALLRSARDRGVLEPHRLEAFRRSLRTVTSDFTDDFEGVLEGRLDAASFMLRYGHLRPGTYDILAPRYDRRDDLFDSCRLGPRQPRAERFELHAAEGRGLVQLFEEAGLAPMAPEEFVQYCGQAIAGREHSKFVFTRHLSDILEKIAEWGEKIGLTRDDLSYLRLLDVMETLEEPILRDADLHLQDVAQSRRDAGALARSVCLGYLIRDVRDVHVVALHRSAPNFVTTKSVEGVVAQVDSHSPGSADLGGKIVCIENADPGYDWIFTRGLAGLISKFGGANSHMTIRCAELSIPAAIGVGEQTFDRIVGAGRGVLQCADHVVRPLYG